MGFRARLCFFLFLTFAGMCFAREIPSEIERNVIVNDYGPPGHNPRHDAPYPPAGLESTALSSETDNFLPPRKGSNMDQKG